MPFSVLKLAIREGIAIEYWDFEPPLEAVYCLEPGLPPIIGLSRTLFSNKYYFRCVLAEELGHYFTTIGNAIPCTYFRYSNRLETSRIEYRALRWAAQYLIPINELIKALEIGIVTSYDLSDYFEVTEDMVMFRFTLPDFTNLSYSSSNWIISYAR